MFDITLTREVIFAGLAIAVSLVRYATYFWALYKRTARPHVFTWLSWGLTVGIVTIAQFKMGGGPSVWPLAMVSIVCFIISFIALFIGEKDITRSDWLSFASVFIAIVLWQISKEPWVAVMCLLVTDIFSYYPTYRKSWNDPWGEPPVSYIWAGSRYFFTLFAVPDPTFWNMAYIFFSMISDWGLVVFIYWRRKVLAKSASPQL